MKWDFHTYESQPPFFLEEIMVFLQQEGKKANAPVVNEKAPTRKAPRGYPRT